MMDFIKKTPISKGWSGDRKYRAETEDGEVYLFRISPIEQFERKKAEFESMKKVDALGIPMCRPLEFGVCEEGVYSVQTFIDGIDMEEALVSLSAENCYRYGLDAGCILKKLHSIPVPVNAEDWESRFNRKIDRKLKMYAECPLKYENGEAFIAYIAENRHLLKHRPQSYQHGDYHVGNMMMDKNGVLQIIDFNRDDYGDPWEEFNRIVWCAEASSAFASGMVDGYFDGEVPLAFWKLLALYIASNTLSSLPWAIPFGQKEIITMRNQAKNVLSWYNGMKNPIPSWYKS